MQCTVTTANLFAMESMCLYTIRSMNTTNLCWILRANLENVSYSSIGALTVNTRPVM